MRMGGGLTYHATERAVSRDGYVVHLRPMESRIFGVVFARQPAHTRPDQLHEALYGDQARCRSVLSVHICLLNRSEEHTSELQSLMRISYAVFCLKKKTTTS